jgi:hypothetical protein
MRVHLPFRSAALALLLLAAAEARADSVRCSGGLVSTGDSKLDLLGKCGRPTIQDGRLDERTVSLVAKDGTATHRRTMATVETWSYDFGPNGFTYVVTLDAGKIVRIERGGYGYAAEPPRPARIDAARCDPERLDLGDTKLEVLAECGEPSAADLRREEIAVGAPGGDGIVGQTFTREVEVWTYDFGKRRFLRVVELADGKVVRVDTGGYGYGE